jgi:hypothetical protein
MVGVMTEDRALGVSTIFPKLQTTFPSKGERYLPRAHSSYRIGIITVKGHDRGQMWMCGYSKTIVDRQ